MPRRPDREAWRSPVNVDAAGAWLLTFVLISYVALRGGGFDTVVRGEAGIVAWWLIVAAAAFGLLRSRVGWQAVVGLGLLAAFAGWTALSLAWTESTEQTLGEVGRMAAYVGFLAVALLLAGRAHPRHAVDAVGCAITLVAAVALLSRLRFAWFAAPDIDRFLPAASQRLAYPLNYWNALAALMAIGIPALLHTATGARRPALRAVAASAIPLLALCTSLTLSRGGAIAAAAGVVVFVILAPNRLGTLATLLACGIGSAALILAIAQRHAIRDGLRTPLAQQQANQLVVICLVVVVAVALLSAGLTLLLRRARRPAWMVFTRGATSRCALLGLVAAAVIFLASGGGGFLDREWRQFKTPAATSSQESTLSRLSSVSGNGRYQYWKSAAAEQATRPLAGTGAGTFEHWWARHQPSAGGFVHDAHSLYVQAFGELGIIGLALIGSFLVFALGSGIATCARTVTPDRRLAVAAATAGVAAFAVSAAVEWIWFIAVLPITLFTLVAVILRTPDPPSARPTPPTEPRRRRHWGDLAARASVCTTGLGAITLIAITVAATSEVRASQALVRKNQLAAAVARARTAEGLQPYAATPLLQEALVLEQAGDLSNALTPARRATRAEPTNWRTWLILSRLDARTGNALAALAAYRRSRSLNPHSPIFAARSGQL